MLFSKIVWFQQSLAPFEATDIYTSESFSRSIVVVTPGITNPFFCVENGVFVVLADLHGFQWDFLRKGSSGIKMWAKDISSISFT